MRAPDRESVDRFRARTERIDEGTLYRNLEAGVYGPSGSSSRVVAEHALAERFGERVEAVRQAAGADTVELRAKLDELERKVRVVALVAGVALLAGLVAWARVMGWF